MQAPVSAWFNDDLAFLIGCEKEAHAHPKLGYVGADLTYLEVIYGLSKADTVKQEHVEAALFSYLSLIESGSDIRHPEGLDAAELGHKLAPPGYRFDEELFIFVREKRERK